MARHKINFGTDRRAVSTVEAAGLAALIAIAVMAGFGDVGQGVGRRFNAIGNLFNQVEPARDGSACSVAQPDCPGSAAEG